MLESYWYILSVAVIYAMGLLLLPTRLVWDNESISIKTYKLEMLYLLGSSWPHTLQWRHNGRDNVSNHQPHDCLLNRLFRRRSKNTSKRVTGLCAGNSPEFNEDRWIPRTNGQLHGKCFHLMTSSWSTWITMTCCTCHDRMLSWRVLHFSVVTCLGCLNWHDVNLC